MSTPTSKQFNYLLALYSKLEEAAEEGVFTGSRTSIFRELHISNAYNPKLFRILESLGCIETIQRGSARQPTIMKIHRAPTLEEYNEKQHSGRVNRRLTSRTRLANLEGRVEIIERRMPNIDINNYVSALETRLAEIEARLTAQERDKGGTDFASSS